MKDVKQSILTNAYPKNYEGYQHWQYFITKDYYENYLPKPLTVFELCQSKDSDKVDLSQLTKRASSQAELISQMQDLQKIFSNSIIDEKNPTDEQIVADWLRSKTKHFGRMSPDLVRELAQLTFALPDSLGGSQYRNGELIACKGLKSRLIFIVFEGTVRQCTLLNDF